LADIIAAPVSAATATAATAAAVATAVAARRTVGEAHAARTDRVLEFREQQLRRTAAGPSSASATGNKAGVIGSPTGLPGRRRRRCLPRVKWAARAWPCR
jgi:hypothetical protein